MKIFWIIAFVLLLSGCAKPTDDLQEDPLHVKIPIVAAADEIGMMGNVTLHLVPGSGKILFESDPAIDTDMQYSAIIALAYAEQYSGRMLNGSDMVIDFDINMDVFGGVSAGAPLTVGMIALLEGKQVNQSIVLTGTINPDGSIGRIGETREKATAARDHGHEIILVPSGQSRMRFQNMTLQDYMNDTIIVMEVSNIGQAAKMMIKK